MESDRTPVARRRCTECGGEGNHFFADHEPVYTESAACNHDWIVERPASATTSYEVCRRCGTTREVPSAAHSYKYDEATDRFVPSSYRWPKENGRMQDLWYRLRGWLRRV